MPEQIAQFKQKQKRRVKSNNYFDYSLLIVWVFLMILGYVLLYSASSYTAMTAYGDSLYFLKRQVLATAVGLIPFFAAFFIDSKVYKRFCPVIYIASFISIFVVLSPLGIEINGAKRWINLGPLQFQPAELVKIGVILITAYMISNCSRESLKSIKNVLKIFAFSFVPAVFLYGVTKNMSSAIIVVLISFIMLVIAGANKKFVAGFIALMIAGTTGLILLAHAMSGSASFRLARILAWLHPENYSESGGYQVMQGLYAIASGGIFGKGLGNSAQKMGFLPESTNDMIFSVICEELGIFGAIAILALFVFLIHRMYLIATHTADLFDAMLVCGIIAQIAVQVVLHVAVVTNSMPNTGVSLPFISYGGTSLAFLMLAMGIVFSVSRKIQRAV